MIYAGILAGGYGWDQRKDDMPKQFMPIGSKPIIIHTVEQFIVNPSIQKIIIAVPENWVVYTKDLLRKHITAGDKIDVILGGHNKNNTLHGIVNFIEAEYGIEEKDVLVSHDAIRPFVTQRIINENIEAVKKYDSANTAVPTIDTIIKAGKEKQIVEITPDRIFYSEQTPQTFCLKKLQEIYKNEQLAKRHVNAVKMFMEAGNSVRLVYGEYANIKIVTQYDLEVANAILRDKTND